jgi:nicotinate-nucleotide pyrophosphorylase
VIEQARSIAPSNVFIEVEVENLGQLEKPSPPAPR